MSGTKNEFLSLSLINKLKKKKKRKQEKQRGRPPDFLQVSARVAPPQKAFPDPTAKAVPLGLLPCSVLPHSMHPCLVWG